MPRTCRTKKFVAKTWGTLIGGILDNDCFLPCFLPFLPFRYPPFPFFPVHFPPFYVHSFWWKSCLIHLYNGFLCTDFVMQLVISLMTCHYSRPYKFTMCDSSVATLEWSKGGLEPQKAWQSVCSNSAEWGKPASEFQCHWRVQRPSLCWNRIKKTNMCALPTDIYSKLPSQSRKKLNNSHNLHGSFSH